MAKVECKICHNILSNNHSLSMHIKKQHNMTCEEYYTTYISKHNMSCCICGNKNNFISLNKGFNSTCSKKCGHIKKRITNINKYGVEIASKNSSVKQKIINTFNFKYGDNTIYNVNYRQQAMLNKYGVDNPMKLERFKNKSKEL